MHPRALSTENITAYIHAHGTIFVILVKNFEWKKCNSILYFLFCSRNIYDSSDSFCMVSKSVDLMSKALKILSYQMFLINKGNFQNTM